MLAGMAGSCKKDECTGKITISYQTFDYFGGIDCGIIIDDQSRGFNFVIDHQSGLESLVECSTLPVIDFEKYTLLLGSYESDKDLTYRSQAVIRDCEIQTVTFRISYDTEQKDTSMLVDYHALIPKIPDDYEVEFEIQTWQINWLDFRETGWI
ncbi:MAG: hypothetical protein AMS26_14170 [Bacteroides sp. SM23_62]|nr:MAG: hypothetical protein AMS26_14170 [Bacteroides sp. SM23_62]